MFVKYGLKEAEKFVKEHLNSGKILYGVDGFDGNTYVGTEIFSQNTTIPEALSAVKKLAELGATRFEFTGTT